MIIYKYNQTYKTVFKKFKTNSIKLIFKFFNSPLRKTLKILTLNLILHDDGVNQPVSLKHNFINLTIQKLTILSFNKLTVFF